jgi:RNA polymerase sigma-70 factor (ECF subfamily)
MELCGPIGQVLDVTQTLRRRIRNGDETAFVELFDGAAGRIYQFALRSTRDAATAEDIVSTTFLEAWKNRLRLHDTEGPLEPWLFGIATNVMRNTGRSRRRHLNAVGRLGVPESEPDIADAVLDEMMKSQQWAAATAALESVNESDRDVFMLCVWSGLDYRTAAQALNIPIGTVRSRLSRARSRIREKGRHYLESPTSPATSTGPQPHAVDLARKEGRS